MTSYFKLIRALLLGNLCLLSAFQANSAETNGDRPNIIYINVDDLGWMDLGCQGSKFYETPNIDSLAKAGIRFTNAYAPASNCAPSRACCLTGQYTPRHGVYTVQNSDRGNKNHRKLIPTKNTLHIEPDNRTIAHLLQDSGYATCTIGKWHVSKDPLPHGFDLNVAGYEAGNPSQAGGYFSPFTFPNCSEASKGVNLTDRLTDKAIEFIEDHREQPFFLYLPYYAVHTPIQPKKDKEAKYTQKSKTKAQAHTGYAAMVETVDDNVGRVLSKLHDLKLTNNTLIVFTSDNGSVWDISKQWPLRAGKGSYYEGGIRVPLIVQWPQKIEPSKVEDTPVCGIDFFPTLAAAAGIEIPEEKLLDGMNLLPLLVEGAVVAERTLFWHFPIYLQAYVKKGPTETRDPKFRTRPGSAMRLGKWKLHHYFEDGGLELYDLEKDLGEKKNLVEQYPEKAQELLQILEKWRSETGAPVPTKLNPDYRG